MSESNDIPVKSLEQKERIIGASNVTSQVRVEGAYLVSFGLSILQERGSFKCEGI